MYRYGYSVLDFVTELPFRGYAVLRGFLKLKVHFASLRAEAITITDLGSLF